MDRDHDAADHAVIGIGGAEGRRGLAANWSSEHIFGDGSTADQVLLEDALRDFLGYSSVPDTFRIHHGDRSLFTHSEAFDL